MLRKERQLLWGIAGEHCVALVLKGKPLRVDRLRLRTSRSRLLLLGVMVVVGAILISCGSSGANPNVRARTSSAGSSAPAVAPTPIANANSMPQKWAEPKELVQAPPVRAFGNGPRIAFVNEEVDYGDLPFEEAVRYIFEFKNVGNAPLVISNALVEVVEGC